MTEYVADANVFFRWYVDQIGFEHAREIRDDFVAGRVELRTVDSVRIEFAHILHKRGVREKRVSVEDFTTVIRLSDLGVQVHDTDDDDIERAGELALRYNLRFFDALVADLALRTGLPLLTSDKKLGHAMNGVMRVEILRGV